ncbi:MAG TPA: aldose epimerase family protein [Trichococcus flocculiformis]|nr:aldose epimerase family protein [Trichococcus flocculiformis]
MKVSETILGQAHGKDVVAYTLTNPNGISLTAMTYGATITELMMPDKNGKSENVILAMDSLDDYVKHRPYYGATIGRIAGRIAKGSFDLDGTRHQLIVNEEENQLHGGPAGLDTHVWDAEIEASADEASIHFTTTDADGANGYPGNLSVTVSYTLTAENEWKINYRATTDQPTLFNPTNHVYFNLSGDINKPILQHALQLNSAVFAELGDGNLPTGALLPAEGTPFDFRDGGKLAIAAEQSHPQTQKVAGFDHPFLLQHDTGKPDAVLSDAESGRSVKMYTDQDCVVIFMHNGAIDKYTIAGSPVIQYAGITLETQALPDAINQEGFGDIVLRPGEVYSAETIYKFEVQA